MTSTQRVGAIDDFRPGPLDAFIADGSLIEVGGAGFAAEDASAGTVFCAYRLQYEADHRTALRTWFRAVAPGGHLILIVSHAFLYERRVALPAIRDPLQRRLYTPRVLIDEIEEALAPNSYRVRLLADADGGYDYTLSDDAAPVGASDIMLVIEKIVPPAWTPEAPPPAFAPVRAPAPDYAFETDHSRIEVIQPRSRRRICLLKLDHLGDFIMGIPTLERARATFADAEITLVVGSWNAAMARDLGVADHVVAFDAFPRNSSEEEVDVPGKTALFRATLPDAYDLAIDLRTDTDTRVLLRAVQAPVRAGIGTRAAFPFLDIFLPLDTTRNEHETAREFAFNHHAFASQGPARRSDHRIFSQAETVERFCAVVWGPYRRLRPGRYIFEPHLELERDVADGMLMLDVALDAQRVAQRFLPSGDRPRLAFEVAREAEFEFRIWALDDTPAIDFSFFGGRLIRAGAASVLHQSEYSALLIELVRMRIDQSGMLRNVADL